MTESGMAESDQLLARLVGGDRGALEQLVQLYHDYLRKLIDLRLDADLRTRIDPSDVVQETHLVVSQRIGDFLERRPASFRVWLRSTALETPGRSAPPPLGEKAFRAP